MAEGRHSLDKIECPLCGNFLVMKGKILKSQI
jgi:hypothetical protein